MRENQQLAIEVIESRLSSQETREERTREMMNCERNGEVREKRAPFSNGAIAARENRLVRSRGTPDRARQLCMPRFERSPIYHSDLCRDLT